MCVLCVRRWCASAVVVAKQLSKPDVRNASIAMKLVVDQFE